MKLITAANGENDAVKGLFTGSKLFYDLGTDGKGDNGSRNFGCTNNKLKEKTAKTDGGDAKKNKVVTNIADAKIFVQAHS
jgi:hypothetical protein